MRNFNILGNRKYVRGSVLALAGAVAIPLAGCSTVSKDQSAAALDQALTAGNYDILAHDRGYTYVGAKVAVGNKCLGAATTQDNYDDSTINFYVRTNPDLGGVDVESFEFEHDQVVPLEQMLARPLIARSCITEPAQ